MKTKQGGRQPSALVGDGRLGKHKLEGMWFHTLKDGEIYWQGKILSVDGKVVLCQLYEWCNGEPTTVKALPKEFMYSDQCRLYHDNEAMLRAYDARMTAVHGDRYRPMRGGDYL